MPRAIVALGSNQGDSRTTICRAIHRLAEFATIIATSSLYTTAPVGFADQPDFLNGVIVLQTGLGPYALLRRLRSIEASLGRRRVLANGPRSIDLDIVWYDARVSMDRRLTLPHPRRLSRGFVMIPAAEVAHAWIDPIEGKSLAALVARDRSKYERVERIVG